MSWPVGALDVLKLGLVSMSFSCKPICRLLENTPINICMQLECIVGGGLAILVGLSGSHDVESADKTVTCLYV